MTSLDVPAGERRLESYLDRIGKVLGRDERRASFATYVLGILGDGAPNWIVKHVRDRRRKKPR